MVSVCGWVYCGNIRLVLFFGGIDEAPPGRFWAVRGMKDKPFSGRVICCFEGLKSWDKLRMLDVVLQPRSGFIVLGSCLGLSVIINLIDCTSFQRSVRTGRCVAVVLLMSLRLFCCLGVRLGE